MFKLIASDMDGTLLDENGQVPPETYELILALHEHGVHFAASSGRRYDRLCEFFAPVRDKMDFVAANGAQVYADGKMVDREVYSHLAIQLRPTGAQRCAPPFGRTIYHAPYRRGSDSLRGDGARLNEHLCRTAS